MIFSTTLESSNDLRTGCRPHQIWVILHQPWRPRGDLKVHKFRSRCSDILYHKWRLPWVKITVHKSIWFPPLPRLKSLIPTSADMKNWAIWRWAQVLKDIDVEIYGELWSVEIAGFFFAPGEKRRSRWSVEKIVGAGEHHSTMIFAAIWIIDLSFILCR